MTTDIKIANPGNIALLNIENWLRENVGPGSMRTIKNSFMGMDDWYFTYDIDNEDGFEYDEEDDSTENLIFTFRREADATVFALKWSTQTMN